MTEQHEADAQLNLQKRLLDLVQESVIATDLRGSITYWNRHAEELYGWPASEVLGRPILEVTPIKQSRRKAAEVRVFLRQGSSWRGEVEVQRKDGRTFPVLVTVSPLIDEAGQLIGMMGVSQDITSQRRTSEERWDMEAQLNEAQQIANVGSWAYDLRTGGRLWSRQMFAIHGLSPIDDPTPDLIRAVIHPDDWHSFDENTRATVAGSDSSTLDYRVLREDGLRYVHLSARLVRDADGNPMKVVGIAEDTTNARAATALLEQQGAQQATVANLGTIALSRATPALLFEVAVSVTAEIISGDVSEILMWRGTSLQMVGEFGRPDNFASGALVDGGPRSQAAYVTGLEDPVVFEDLRRETRFDPSPLLLAEGIISGISVPIHVRRGPWGLLSVYFRAPRSFTSNESQFLRGIAATLGQGIERRTAEEELLARASQQSAVASLGQSVLSSISETTLHLCCSLIRDTLGVDFAVLLRYLPAQQDFVLVAGSRPSIPDGRPWDEAQAACTLSGNQTLTIADYAIEKRFDATTFVQAGVRSGLSVPVRSGLSRFGVIEAGYLSLRQFSEADVQFVRAMANVLAEAMERELSTEAMMISEARYREVVEGASELIYTLSPDGRFTSLNRAFTAMTGWKVEDWLGRPFLELLPLDDQSRGRERFDALLRDKLESFDDARLLGSDGQIIQVAAISFPRVVKGEVHEVYGFARDVTEQRRAEKRRARASEELERILESTAEGIYAIDCQGMGTMVNRAAIDMLGYQRELWIGRDVHQLLHPTRPDGSPFPRLLCSIHGANRELVSNLDEIFLRHDGSPMPIVATASEIRDRDRLEGYVVTFNDVSEYRRLQTQVEQAKRMTSLGRLAATVAHEFNNVLMGISPFIDLLRRETTTPRAVMALDQMSKSVGRGKGIADEILRFTRNATPVLEGFESRPFMETVANEAANVAGSGYRIEMDCPETTTPLRGDANQLHQILMNLVINARDAMPAGGTISLGAEACLPDGDYPFGFVADPCTFVHLTVRDNGPGMEDGVLQHIFEPLFTTKQHGTGLGLAVMHQVVTSHGGQVFVESKVNEGTAFHIFIPAALPEDAPQPEQERTPASRTRFHSVLLVEDDPAVSEGLSALLDLEGMSVEVAETGRAALASLDRGRPDLVVLDIGLPDMKGTEVYAVIAKNFPTLPVLFSTGHGDRAELSGELAQPHTGFLMKPYDIETFFEALEKLETSQPAEPSGHATV
ncbi:MAG: PAS domain S-box protein [Thermoanaerobaculia bacterium]